MRIWGYAKTLYQFEWFTLKCQFIWSSIFTIFEIFTGKAVSITPIIILSLRKRVQHQTQFSFVCLGHTNWTHSYLIKTENPPGCNCNSTLTVYYKIFTCELYTYHVSNIHTVCVNKISLVKCEFFTHVWCKFYTSSVWNSHIIYLWKMWYIIRTQQNLIVYTWYV